MGREKRLDLAPQRVVAGAGPIEELLTRIWRLFERCLEDLFETRPGRRVIVLICTVSDPLSTMPSLTMSRKMYSPSRSGTKVGFTFDGALRIAVLPAGRLMKDQAKVNGWLSGADDALPSSMTVCPTNTV